MNLENHTQCPICKQYSIPPYDELVIAIKCQNKECGVILKTKRKDHTQRFLIKRKDN